MTKKRFRVNELAKYNYSDIGEYIDEYHTDRPLRNDILVELLNELNDEKEILFDAVKKTDDLINRFGGDELKHEWKKEVTMKYR